MGAVRVRQPLVVLPDIVPAVQPKTVALKIKTHFNIQQKAHRVLIWRRQINFTTRGRGLKFLIVCVLNIFLLTFFSSKGPVEASMQELILTCECMHVHVCMLMCSIHVCRTNKGIYTMYMYMYVQCMYMYMYVACEGL